MSARNSLVAVVVVASLCAGCAKPSTTPPEGGGQDSAGASTSTSRTPAQSPTSDQTSAPVQMVVISQVTDLETEKPGDPVAVHAATTEQIEAAFQSLDWSGKTGFPFLSIGRGANEDHSLLKAVMLTDQPGVIQVLWQKTGGEGRFLRTVKLTDREQLQAMVRQYATSGDIETSAEWTTE